MSDPTLLIVGERRRPGRPRNHPEPCASVSSWVPEPYHDKLIDLANQHKMSVSEIVKRLIIKQLDRPIPTNK